MAEIPWLFGAAFKNQTTRGTATTMATIGGGSGTGTAIDNVTDGAVLGDADSGTGESGISITFGKSITEKAVLTGSFTRNFANYIGRTVEAFQMAIPLKGNGETASSPKVAADCEPDLGIVALLRAAGLSGANSGTTREYTPTATNLVTAALYMGETSANNGARVIVRDVEASSLALAFTPGEPATATFDLTGVFDSYDETGSWPANTFDYGNQATVSAPSVVGVGFTWGPDTPAARSIGFSTLSITISNETEEIQSANSSTGSVPRQTGRTISITGTIDATDGEILYELDQLGESAIANAESLTFQVGTTAAAGETVNAYSITVADPELISLEPARLGNSQSWTIELVARSATANDEFALTFS